MKAHDVLGTRSSLLSYRDVMRMIARWRDRQERHYVTLTPPYSVLMCRRDARLHEATQAASLTLPDGVGIILAAKLLRYPHCGRVTGPTLMLKLCDWGRTAGLRHYFYGGARGVADALAEKLKQSCPGLDGEYFTAFSTVAKARGWRHFATIQYAAQVQIVASVEHSTMDAATKLVTDFALDAAPAIGQLLENLGTTRGAEESREPVGTPWYGTNNAQHSLPPPGRPAP